MTTNKRRVLIPLTPEWDDLLTQVSEQTGLTAPKIIQKLLLAHFSDLVEYSTWLQQLPADSAKLKAGRFLLHSYGPGTLVEDIKQLDPSFVSRKKKIGK